MRRVEHVITFILLLLATGAGQAFFAKTMDPGEAGGQPITQVVFGLIYLFLLVSLLKYRSAVGRLVLAEKWTALLCLWALVSIAWSVQPGETLRRGLALCGTSLAGLYLAVHYDPKQQLRMMSHVLGIGAIASLVVVILLPGVGILPDSGWQGVYNLKNSLGRMMSLGAFCFALLALGERRHRAVRIAMFLLCSGLLIMSRSATAVVVTLLMLALLPLRKLVHLRTRKLLAAVALLVPIFAAGIFWVVEYSDEILAALGRTSSLTGRIPLWQVVLKEIALRPLRGYGFTAFWNSWEGQRVSDTVAWDTAVPHAHNGFLEIWLGLGLIGLAIVLISLARNFIRALHAARSHREIEESWPLLLVAFTVLYNLTESSLMNVNSITWMAYIAASFWLVRVEQEEKLADAPEHEAEPAYSA